MKAIFLLLTILSATFLITTNAFCWPNCAPRRCSFDTECGVGCFCYKGDYEIHGVCVTEQ